MLHPAFLTAGLDTAEEPLDTPYDAFTFCSPPETDARTAAAPCGKRRRLGTDGSSKEAKRQQQAFTKRKRTIMDKAYELSEVADAKVFCFFVSQEGNAFAYASPNFQAALQQSHLDALKLSGGCAAWDRVRVMVQPECQDSMPATQSPQSIEALEAQNHQQQPWGTTGGTSQLRGSL